MLKRVVFPHIGQLPVRQVTSRHILDILKKANENNGPSVKDEAKRTMSSIFEFAISNLMVETDPVYTVRKALPANKTQHKRPLEKEEIGEFLRDLAGYERNFQVVSAFKLMWLTLARPKEIVGMRWDQIDFEKAIWHRPADLMKKRKQHTVPLPKQATFVVSSKWPSGISGGPIFNENGYVIGIVSSSLHDPDVDELTEGYSFWFSPIPAMRGFLPIVDTDNEGSLRVWAVLKQNPWELAGIFAIREQAEAYKAELGADYEVIFGSNRFGTDDFVYSS